MQFTKSYKEINPNPFRPGNLVEFGLTEKEKQIQQVIVDFCNYYDKQSGSKTPLIARFTGGWVRDKMLGLQSHDIDIAVSKLSGVEFAEGINEYIAEPCRNHSDPKPASRNVHTIKRNPKKMKHMEVATTKLFGQDVDIVKLRCGEFVGDDLDPENDVEIAKQDAFRRDATVNALFFNLQKNEIEDFTNKGIQDLKQGILCSPIVPLTAFSHDPFQVMRLIRFACTLGFELSDQTLDAMANPEIKKDLLKIARERLGSELSKALTSSRPQVCLLLLQYCNLYDAVFYLSPHHYPVRDYQIPQIDLIPVLETVQSVLADPDPSFLQLLGSDFFNFEPNASLVNIPNLYNRRLCFWLAIALSPFDCPVSKDSAALAKIFQKQGTVHAHIIKYSLKLAAHISKTVDQMVQAYSAGMSCYCDTGPEKYTTLSRKEIGLWIRKFGQDWGLVLLYCLVKDLLFQRDAQECGTQKTVKEIGSAYSCFINRILSDKNDLKNAWSLQPLLDKKEVQVLANKKGGPWIGAVLASLIEIQLENQAFTIEEAKTWVKENSKED